MKKSPSVRQLEEDKKFLRLYHDKEITALNIARLLNFTAGIYYPGASNVYGQFSNHSLDKELKEVYQSVRISKFLKHFSYHSNRDAINAIAQADSIPTIHPLHMQGNIVSPQQKKAYLQNKRSLSFQHEKIISALSSNKYLINIDLEKMFMKDESLKHFSNILTVNSQITHLNLAHNDITEQGGKVLAEKLINYKELTHFNISNNKLSLLVLQDLAKAFITNGNLIYLNIGDNPTIVAGSDKAIKDIIDANGSLQSLSINTIPLKIEEIVIKDESTTKAEKEKARGPSSDRQSSTDAAQHITSGTEMPVQKIIGNLVLLAIQAHNSITCLNISNCFSKSQNKNDVAESIARLLSGNTSIIEIDMSGNAIGAPGMAKIAERLKSNKTLHILNISNNNLQEEGGEVIANILVGNHSIIKLNVSSNNLSYAAMQPISDALKHNKSLKDISITHNNLDEAGGLFVGKALEQNRTLTSLDISNNNIQAVGATYIAQALLENKILKHLNLANNYIAGPGLCALLEEIKEGDSILLPIDKLITLNLATNQIDTPTIILFAAKLKSNTALVNLFLDNNALQPQGVQSVLQAIYDNPHIKIVKLGLSNTTMGDNGAVHILTYLKDNLSIAELDISNNNIYKPAHIVNFISANSFISRFKAVPQVANADQQDVFEDQLCSTVRNSSIIELPGISDRINGTKLFFEVSKHHDNLQSNLRILETEEGNRFDIKQLLILLKQLQGRTSETVAPELSYADMKSDEFYIERIAEIFKKYHKPAHILKNASLPVDTTMKATTVTAETASAATEAAEGRYFDALVDSLGSLGYTDLFLDLA